MTDLNNRDAIKLLDKSNVLGSIEQLPDQIQDAWNQVASQNLQPFPQPISHVVIAGMGGSALGAEVVKSAAKPFLKCSVEIINDYTLPAYINQNTLVILSSYSGTTEETLATAQQAQKANAKIAVITAGGALATLALENHYPSYIIDPKYNPSNQPRMAVGYTISGLIGLLASFDLLTPNLINIDGIVAFLKANNSKYAPEQTSNPAIDLAHSANEKIIFLVSAEHLTGATHVINNQINENAKNLTVELKLPELNHHFMEGLPYPKNKTNSIFWFIDSTLYSDKIKLRLKLTQDVVQKNDYATRRIEINQPDIFTQVFELIQLGSYTNFYLAMIHGIDPAPIPWVDYFKDQLQKHSD